MGIEILPRQSEQESRATLLAQKFYNPTTTATLSTSASNTVQDIDATNLVITFVAPASGAVYVRLTAWAFVGAEGQFLAWTLRDGTTELTNVRQGVTQSATAGRRTVEILVTGLSPGQTYTWKWAHIVNGGSVGSIRVGDQGTSTAAGAAVMQVYDAGVTTLGYMTGGVWNGPQSINAGGPNNTGLVVVGASGQVSNLQEWKDSAGTVHSKIDKDGRATTRMRTYRAKGVGIVVSTNNDAPIIQTEDSAYGAPCVAVSGAETGVRIDEAGIWSVEWLAIRSAGATAGRTWMRLKGYASATHPFGVASKILAAHEITQHAEDHFSLSYTGWMSTGVHRFEFYQESGGSTTMNSYAQLTYHGPL